ncbi:hypothetical protein D3C73_1115650 [compost metagenome]
MAGVPYPVEAVPVICAGRAEDHIRPLGAGHTHDLRKFNIVAGQHGDGSSVRLEHLQPFPRPHIPALYFSGRDMQLSLLGNSPVRIKKMGHIIKLTVPSQYMSAANDMHRIFLGIPGKQLPVTVCKLRQILYSEGFSLLIANGHQLCRQKFGEQDEFRTVLSGCFDVMLALSGKLPEGGNGMQMILDSRYAKSHGRQSS